MPRGLPAILDVAQKYLFEDQDKMVAAGLPRQSIEHIIHLRELYYYWLAHPSKRDRDIVERDMTVFKINRSQAYVDLRLVKELLGNMQQVSKQYHLYRFLEMVGSAYEKAAASGDTRSMVSAAATYAKFTKLDHDDEALAATMPIQIFEATDDPTVAGYKPLPNFREKIKSLKEKYFSEQVMDVEFEPVEFNEDEIFKNGKTKGLPQ